MAPWLVAAALFGAVVALMIDRQASTGDRGGSAGWTAPPAAGAPAVALAIDFGNGATREFGALPWKPGTTVGDLLREAGRFHPALEFAERGTGDMAFLTSLDGVANDPSIGRFWIYEINGRIAERGIGAQSLEAGDRVLWVFKESE
jgi:hypothetical protein